VARLDQRHQVIKRAVFGVERLHAPPRPILGGAGPNAQGGGKAGFNAQRAELPTPGKWQTLSASEADRPSAPKPVTGQDDP